jgi:hypothetical protein
VALDDLSPQLRTRLRRMERAVGLFVALAGALLVTGFGYYLYHTAARKGWFTPKCPYYTFVRSADGLHVGDPVLLMGFSVGEITVIEAEPPESSYNVYVGFDVKQPYYGYIWTDSTARVAGASFLGGRQLEVVKGRTGTPTAFEEDGRLVQVLVDGEKVAFENHRPSIHLPADEAPGLSERAERVAAQLEASLPRITAQVEGVLDDTRQLGVRLGGAIDEARPVVANLNAITKNLRDPNGSLGNWMLPRDLRLRLTTTLESADANLTVLSGTLRNLDAITGSLRTQLDANTNVLGEVTGLLRDTDHLVQGLKRHWLLRSAFPEAEPGPAPVRLEPLPGIPPPGTP